MPDLRWRVKFRRWAIARSVIGALRVTLGLDSAQFETGIKRSQKSVQTVSRSMGIVSRDVQSVERQMRQSSDNIARSMKGLAATAAAFFSGQELMRLADGYTRVQNALKVAGLEGRALADVQERLLGLSSRYGVSLESLAALFGNASQAGKELGASQQQIVKLTESASQSLLITGTSATAASGAILGLQQALASGTVRAEEFNQINEGGLRPLLQAAANSEKFGGSVAKLRQAVIDGKVSSKEFFDAVLAGSAGLEAQASRATLTLSGAIEALNSRLMVYFGEADKANGASAAFAAALSKVADNLDTIIPALAIVGTAIGVRYAAQLGLATAATVAKVAADVQSVQMTNAMAAAHARLSPLMASNAQITNAATAAVTRYSVAAGTAARVTTSLLASMAPVALTLAAITMGFELFSAIAREGEDRLLSNADAANELGVQLSETSKAALTASKEQKGLGSAASGAEPEMWSFKKSVDGLTESLWEQAKAARAARVELLQQQLTERRKVQQEAYDATSFGANNLGRASDEALGRGDILSAFGSSFKGLRSRFANILSGGRTGAEGRRDFQDASAIAAALETEIERLTNTPIGKGDLPAGGGTSSNGGQDKADKGSEASRRRAQREAERAADALRQYASEVAREGAEFTSLQAELNGSIEARRDAELNQIEVDRGIRESSIKADRDLDDAKKQQLVTLNNQNAQARADLVRQQAREEIDQRSIRREQDQADIALELLSLSSDAARTARERRDVELRILATQFEIERRALEIEAASSDLEVALRARQRLAALPALEAGARDSVVRQTQGPLEAYLDGLPKSADEAREALERVQVDGIGGLVDGLADAAIGVRSLGDVFKRVTQQIIADLIRIEMQKALVSGLSSLLGLGGGGAAAAGSGIVFNQNTLSRFGASLPGFATGGSFRVGGAPGVDRNIVSFKATRGEMVDIRRPGQDLGARTITFDMRGAVVTEDLLRQMNGIGESAAVRGAMGGSTMAQETLTRRASRKIPGR